jgi:hypothetical protein
MSGASCSPEAPGLRPNPIFLATAERRAAYFGATIGQSRGKLQRALYCSAVMPWEVLRCRFNVCSFCPSSRQTM